MLDSPRRAAYLRGAADNLATAAASRDTANFAGSERFVVEQPARDGRAGVLHLEARLSDQALALPRVQWLLRELLDTLEMEMGAQPAPRHLKLEP